LKIKDWKIKILPLQIMELAPLFTELECRKYWPLVWMISSISFQVAANLIHAFSTTSLICLFHFTQDTINLQCFSIGVIHWNVFPSIRPPIHTLFLKLKSLALFYYYVNHIFCLIFSLLLQHKLLKQFWQFLTPKTAFSNHKTSLVFFPSNNKFDLSVKEF
jgi:uncharacterized membrane protein YvlD (DUF360 family)